MQTLTNTFAQPKQCWNLLAGVEIEKAAAEFQVSNRQHSARRLHQISCLTTNSVVNDGHSSNGVITGIFPLLGKCVARFREKIGTDSKQGHTISKKLVET